MGSPAPTSEYKPKMTRMKFCPSFDEEDDDDWWNEEEDKEEDDDSGQLKLSDDGVEKNEKSIVETSSSGGEDDEAYNADDDDNDYQVSFYDDQLALEAGTPINLNKLVEYPTMRDIEFETSCGSCALQVGPPVNCCSWGHVICDWCLGDGGKTTCDTDIVVSPEQEIIDKCGARIIGIDAAIRSTQYYKEFMKSCRYECGFKQWGCDVVLSGMEITQHEFLQCPFRFIKYCQYRCDGCTSTFKDLGENLKHLSVEHDLPIQWNSQTHFNVRFDPKEISEMDGYSFRDIPIIRAGVGASDKHFLCLLITESVENDKTRLWFLKALCENESRFSAIIGIHLPGSDENALEDTITEKLCVVSDVVNVKNLVEPADGRKYYVDLDNKMLENYCIEKDEKKYFGLMVVIVEHIKKSQRDGDEMH